MLRMEPCFVQLLANQQKYGQQETNRQTAILKQLIVSNFLILLFAYSKAQTFQANNLKRNF